MRSRGAFVKRRGAVHVQHADTEALIRLVRSGDCDAFSELMSRYDGIVGRTATLILTNIKDAKDAALETYLKVFMKTLTFEGASKFSTWLTRIAINASLMRMSKALPTDFFDRRAHGWGRNRSPNAGQQREFLCRI
jgi:hypothetical protein